MHLGEPAEIRLFFTVFLCPNIDGVVLAAGRILSVFCVHESSASSYFDSVIGEVVQVFDHDLRGRKRSYLRESESFYRRKRIS